MLQVYAINVFIWSRASSSVNFYSTLDDNRLKEAEAWVTHIHQNDTDVGDFNVVVHRVDVSWLGDLVTARVTSVQQMKPRIVSLQQ